MSAVRGYDKRFFSAIRSGCEASAAAVVPIVMGALRPRRVVDVGCGEGLWGKAFEAAGCEVLGIDGPWVDPEIPSVSCDLAAEALPSLEDYDLAVCLEVAEHLPPARAESFVEELCELAPTVLFSAAVPGQGGNKHLNEQWPDYWTALFAQHDYPASGALRWEIWEDDLVKPWYRQNLLVFGELVELSEDDAPAVIHPGLWQHHGHA